MNLSIPLAALPLGDSLASVATQGETQALIGYTNLYSIFAIYTKLEMECRMRVFEMWSCDFDPLCTCQICNVDAGSHGHPIGGFSSG